MLGALFGSGVPTVSAEKLAEMLRQKDTAPVVVDVRTPAEFAQAHIAGARLVPLAQLGQQIGKLPRDQPLVTVCRSGHRSLMAARQLKRAGFQVNNLTGGMLAWKGPTTTK